MLLKTETVNASMAWSHVRRAMLVCVTEADGTEKSLNLLCNVNYSCENNGSGCSKVGVVLFFFVQNRYL